MQFDRRYQEGLNGPLTATIRGRIQKLREQGLTLDELGRLLGFSGTFVGRIIRQEHAANVRTRHISSLLEKIENAEVQGNKNTINEKNTNKTSADNMTLEELVRAISAKGFDVSISPRS